MNLHQEHVIVFIHDYYNDYCAIAREAIAQFFLFSKRGQIDDLKSNHFKILHNIQISFIVKLIFVIKLT